MKKLTFFLALVFCSVPARQTALLVGAAQGTEDLPTLRYTDSDTRRLEQILKAYGGFSPDDIIRLSSPSSQQLDQTLTNQRQAFTDKENPQSFFLFYYSGHADGSALLLGEQAYELQQLKQSIDRIPAKMKLLILDACYSGALTTLKGGKREKPIILDNLKSTEGTVILTASTEKESAQESDIFKASVFSHHFSNALTGSADISGDKKVTLLEAYNYTYHKTIETTALSQAGVQHPSYAFNLKGDGDVVLTNLKNSNTGLLFTAGVSGMIIVIDKDKKQLVADFFKAIGEETFIALNPGEYIVVRNRTRNLSEKTELHIRSGSIEAIADNDFNTMYALPATLKGIPAKVLEPYANGSNPDQSNKYGLGLTFGEGSGGFGLSFVRNFNRQHQLGMTVSVLSVSTELATDTVESNMAMYTLTYRRYMGAAYAAVGLSYNHGTFRPGDSTSTSYDGSFIALPVWLGTEYGLRNRLFVGGAIGVFPRYHFTDHPYIKNNLLPDVSSKLSWGISLGFRIGYYFL